MEGATGVLTPSRCHTASDTLVPPSNRHSPPLSCVALSPFVSLHRSPVTSPPPLVLPHLFVCAALIKLFRGTIS